MKYTEFTKDLTRLWLLCGLRCICELDWIHSRLLRRFVPAKHVYPNNMLLVTACVLVGSFINPLYCLYSNERDMSFMDCAYLVQQEKRSVSGKQTGWRPSIAMPSESSGQILEP
jgi:hypothetical protein